MSRFKPLLKQDILLILISGFLYNWSAQLLIPTFPLYVLARNGNEKTVGLLTGLFAFTAVFIRPFLGRLMDQKGRKFVLVLSLGVAATGPLFYALSTNFFFLSLARVYHAISLAGFITAAQTLTADLSEPKDRGMVVSVTGVVNGIALASSPFFSFLLYDRYGFTPLFITASLTAAAALPLVALIREPQRTVPKEKITTPLVASLKNSWVLLPCLVLFTVTLGQGVTNAFLPLHSLSLNIYNSSIFFTVYSISSMVASALTAVLANRFSGKTLALPGLVFIIVGALGLSQLTSVWGLLGPAILMGAGFAATYNVLLTLILNKTNVDERAQGISLYANSFDLGISTGSMALGALAAYSFKLLWLAVAVITGLGLLLTLVVIPKEEVGAREKLVV